MTLAGLDVGEQPVQTAGQITVLFDQQLQALLQAVIRTVDRRNIKSVAGNITGDDRRLLEINRLHTVADYLDAARADILAFTRFPKEVWRQIWSNNPQERLNKEVRRRTDVIGIFPNRAAIIRLVGALLCEQNEEWCVSRRYMSLGTIAAVRTVGAGDSPPPLPGKEPELEANTEAA